MNQYISTPLNWIKAHPFYAALGLVALLLLYFSISGGIGSRIENFRQTRFDKKIAAQDKEISDLKIMYDAEVKRGDEAEAKAVLKAAEAKELQDLIAAKGGQIEKAANELEQRIEEAKRDAGTCVGSIDQRVCVCAKLAALGFECN
jgi:flagellar biosynthesis/type III secretory pathway protein FliH